METSLFLAKVIGPVLMVTALHFFIDSKRYHKIVEDFFKNTAVLFITAFITFILGLLVVLTHNVWSADWKVLITLAGWSMLIKGALYLLFPRASESFVKHFTINNTSLWAALILIFVWGLYLSYVGFYM